VSEMILFNLTLKLGLTDLYEMFFSNLLVMNTLSVPKNTYFILRFPLFYSLIHVGRIKMN
jgi:hypothetical protein